MNDILILVGIFKNEGIKQKQLATLLNTTQQTISYKIKKLKKLGYINDNGITEEGISYLMKIHKTLSSVLFNQNVVLKGKVFEGVGEGGRFLSIPEYKNQIKKKMHFDPYPGTLNIRLSEEEARKRASLPTLEFEYIQGFIKEGKKYGGIYVKKCYINGVEGAIIIPVKSRYGFDVIELISPYYLRKKLKIKDGSTIEVVL